MTVKHQTRGRGVQRNFAVDGAFFGDLQANVLSELRKFAIFRARRLLCANA